jgi:hypothetical protein
MLLALQSKCAGKNEIRGLRMTFFHIIDTFAVTYQEMVQISFSFS